MACNMIIERATDLIQTEIDDELVALDIEQGNCFGFNATAARVWQLVEQPQTLDAIIDALTSEFDVERAECRSTVVALIEDLAARKLVRTRTTAD